MENQTSNQNPYLIPGAIVIAAFLIVGAIILSQTSVLHQLKGKSESEIPTKQKQLSPEDSAKREVDVELEGWPTLGDPNAPIVMVEYSDFACHFCARFWQETLPLIKKDYIEKGKVRFVYKDFIVVGGERAAEAAHCAQEQGKFWEYHDLLFSRVNQDRDKWSNSEIHSGYAKELGLDVDAFIKCFESRRYQSKIELSTQEAIKNGAQGTPYFLIDNQSIFGARPYSTFQKMFDEILSSP